MRDPRALLLTGACVLASLCVGTAAAAAEITISIVGTNDLHGHLFTDREGRGGLPVLGGFVDNLRAARAADGGAVLVLDAGDTFQGGIESNLSEGLMVVDAYNAIGYTALGIGNHDFDYGAADPRGPVAQWLPEHSRGTTGDMLGALKAAAARARFPFLAANILDAATGQPVRWPNVAPSTIVDAAGVRVGVIGMMTETGLRQTLAAHVEGLATNPLVPTVVSESRALRARGADIVVLTTHAGGWCSETKDPYDLRSCDDGSEIFRVARELPAGTLQAIVAGHTHGTVAHFVNGLAIASVPNFGTHFGRMDLTFDTAQRHVTRTRIHEPQRVCTRADPASGDCTVAPDGAAVEYEGRPVVPSERVAAAILPELERVQALRAESLGVAASTPIARTAGAESALGNLFADALRATLPGTDVALSYGPGRGGLRADLPIGPLTFGHVYDVFPFDNRVARLTMTGEQLARVLADQLPQLVDGRRGLLSVSGVRVAVSCEDGRLRTRLMHESGAPVQPQEELVVAATSYSAGRAAWAAIDAATAARAKELPLLVRDVVAAWLLERGGDLHADDFIDPQRPRWQLPAAGPAACS
jgi:5'-nucleotidase